MRNEERDLAPSVRRLHAYLRDRFPFTARITIADNGSTDGTWVEALTLESELSLVRAVHLDQPGRGRALRAIWSASDADVLAYMDVDLSTDLNALLPLVAPLLSGHSDVAIGTRLAPGARVIRGPRREIISRCYNLLLHATLQVGFSDAQCGFKAIRADKARVLLPLTEDSGWFFDTELLVLAERAGLRIHEIPVDWIDDTDSRVDVVATALADLRGIARLGGGLLRGSIQVPVLGDLGGPPGGEDGPPRLRPDAGTGLRLQLPRFVAVGAVSTIAYILLYLALRGAMGPQEANALSLLATTVVNTAVNRRFTFGVRGRQHAARHSLPALGVPGPAGPAAAGHSTAAAGHSPAAASRCATGRDGTPPAGRGLHEPARPGDRKSWICRQPSERERPMTAVTARTAHARGNDGPAAGGRFARLLRGSDDDPRWARPALLALLALTALLYTAGLSRSGWANDYYAAAVQASTKSWKAFFFGSSDASNFITVDKTPASLWVMDISARIFGVNYWSLLLPQALEGVATVGVLYATVRRWFGPAARASWPERSWRSPRWPR